MDLSLVVTNQSTAACCCCLRCVLDAGAGSMDRRLGVNSRLRSRGRFGRPYWIWEGETILVAMGGLAGEEIACCRRASLQVDEEPIVLEQIKAI